MLHILWRQKYLPISWVCFADPGGNPSSSPGSEPNLAETNLSSLPPASALSLPMTAGSFGQSNGSSAPASSVMPIAPSLLGGPAPKEPRSRDSKAEVRRARR